MAKSGTRGGGSGHGEPGGRGGFQRGLRLVRCFSGSRPELSPGSGAGPGATPGLAARPTGATSQTAPFPGLHSAPGDRFPGDPRGPRFRRRPGDRCRARPVRRLTGHVHRGAEGARHQTEAVPEFRNAEAGRLSQGITRHADCRQVRAADRDPAGHAGSLSGNRRGRARAGGSHRAQSSRNGPAGGAGGGGVHRRGRQRRRAGVGSGEHRV